MTTQLRLVDTPQTQSDEQAAHARSARSGSSLRYSRPVLVAEPHKIRDRLDDHTRERGLLGVSQARQALRDAKKRAIIRDAERRACRDDELAELAAEAKRPNSGLTRVAPAAPHESDTSHRPDDHAAA